MKLSKNCLRTKKGIASLYITIFATILFGVITLSFVRMMLTNSVRSSDDELSQSAYDAALAGVEDAKRAIKKYYSTIDAGGAANLDLFSPECNRGIHEVLGVGDGSSEVMVGNAGINGNETNQAYTCVKISRNTSDFRSALSSENRTRIIPLSVESNTLSQVKTVEFSWFSTTNDTMYQGLNYPGFSNKSTSPIPPVIQLTLVSMGGETYVPSNQSADGNFDELTGYNSTMILYPQSRARCEELAAIHWAMPASTCQEVIDADSSAFAGNQQNPYQIQCANVGETISEFACTAKINVSFTNPDTAFLVAALPYGDVITDFAVKLRNGSADVTNSIVMFDGAQISIDSTGRANDLFRRVETRVDISDTYFPVPQYALDVGGGGEDSVSKKRWITANCWTEKGACDNNGQVEKSELDNGRDAIEGDTPDSDLVNEESTTNTIFDWQDPKR